MSIAKKQSHRTVLSLFVFTSLICLSSCKKENSKIAEIKGNVHNFRSSKAIDANNLVSLAILSKTTVEKNIKLGVHSENSRVINFSKVIDANQNGLLESVTELANSKLIIINSISKIELPKDTIKRVAFYFTSIEKDLTKQITLLENLKKQTLDQEIKQFASEELQKQNRMLQLTQRFKIKIINN